MEPSREKAALERLQRDGLIEWREGGWRTTRRWQAAMARAALRLYDIGDAGEDLRLPVAHALIELYGISCGEDTLTDLVLALLPIELRSLGLRETSPPRRETSPPQKG